MSDDTSDIVKRVTQGWAEGSPDVLLNIACKEIADLRQQLAEARGLYLQRNYRGEQLERELATAIQERDDARWEVCGFHHLTGFLAGDYALSRGWGYLNDEKKRHGFPKSVSDFNEYLKGQDKVLLEIIERLRSDLRNSRMANEANTNNQLFREGKL